jgi:hypothetical protein
MLNANLTQLSENCILCREQVLSALLLSIKTLNGGTKVFKPAMNVYLLCHP